MAHPSQTHSSQTLSEFLNLLQNKWTFPVACQKQCDPEACRCLRHIVHVEALRAWWKRTASETTKQTKLQRLLDELGPAEDELGPLDIKLLSGKYSCLTVLSFLFSQKRHRLLGAFHRAGINDSNFETRTQLSDSKLRTELERSPGRNEVDQILESFQKERWAYCPLRLELNMNCPLGTTRLIPPFCHKISLGEGGTASTYLVVVQKDLISDEGLRSAIQETLYKDEIFGQCYRMVLKSYYGRHQSAYELEKKAFSGLKHNGSVPIVGYLGCYTHEYGEGTDAGKAYNLLLEYGDQDLYGYWEDEKNVPPVRAKEITRFWKSLFEVADAIKHIHNLEVQRGKEKPLRYNGWHADIKPDNILLVRGRMKLADFGFSRFSPAISTPDGSVPRELIAGFTDTYGAPEVSMKQPNGTLTSVSQSIDIWSFGCVLSVAATWIVLGFQGIRQYETLRSLAPANTVKGVTYDRFHDGFDVLPEVKKWHNFLRGHIRPSDTVTKKVLNLIERELLQMQHQHRMGTDELCKELARLLMAATEEIGNLETNSKDTDDTVLRALLNVEEVAQNQRSSEKMTNPLQQRLDTTADVTPLDPRQRASMQVKKEEKRKSRRLGQTLYRREILQSELGCLTSTVAGKSSLSARNDHDGATTESPIQEESLSGFHANPSISNAPSAETGAIGRYDTNNDGGSTMSPYTLPGPSFMINDMYGSRSGPSQEYDVHARSLELGHPKAYHANGRTTPTSRPANQNRGVNSELSHYATVPSGSHGRIDRAIEDISGPSSAPPSLRPPNNYFRGANQVTERSQTEMLQASYSDMTQRSFRNEVYEHRRDSTTRDVPLLQTPARNPQEGTARYTPPNPVGFVSEMPLVSSPEIKVTQHPDNSATSPQEITPLEGLRISNAPTRLHHEQHAHKSFKSLKAIPAQVYDLPYDICNQRQLLEQRAPKGVRAKVRKTIGLEGRKPDPNLAKTFDVSRDLVLVIDNGATMFHHWSIAMFVAETLAMKAAGLDKDGMDVYFTVDGEMHNRKGLIGENGRQHLRNALVNAAPDHIESEDCQTDMWDTFCKISQNWSAKGKPATTLLVLTDGLWERTNKDSFDDALIKVAQDPANQRTGKRSFSIQFIRFGNAAKGFERLRYLDDDLCEIHRCKDIVDHCSWRTSVEKMFKGSIIGYQDQNDADEQDMIYDYPSLVALFESYNDSNSTTTSNAQLSPQSPTVSTPMRSLSRSSRSSDREKHQSAPTTLLRKNSSHRRPFSQ